MTRPRSRGARVAWAVLAALIGVVNFLLATAVAWAVLIAVGLCGAYWAAHQARTLALPYAAELAAFLVLVAALVLTLLFLRGWCRVTDEYLNPWLWPDDAPDGGGRHRATASP